MPSLMNRLFRKSGSNGDLPSPEPSPETPRTTQKSSKVKRLATKVQTKLLLRKVKDEIVVDAKSQPIGTIPSETVTFPNAGLAKPDFSFPDLSIEVSPRRQRPRPHAIHVREPMRLSLISADAVSAVVAQDPPFDVDELGTYTPTRSTPISSTASLKPATPHPSDVTARSATSTSSSSYPRSSPPLPVTSNSRRVVVSERAIRNSTPAKESVNVQRTSAGPDVSSPRASPSTSPVEKKLLFSAARPVSVTSRKNNEPRRPFIFPGILASPSASERSSITSSIISFGSDPDPMLSVDLLLEDLRLRNLEKDGKNAILAARVQRSLNGRGPRPKSPRKRHPGRRRSLESTLSEVPGIFDGDERQIKNSEASPTCRSFVSQANPSNFDASPTRIFSCASSVSSNSSSRNIQLPLPPVRSNSRRVVFDEQAIRNPRPTGDFVPFRQTLLDPDASTVRVSSTSRPEKGSSSVTTQSNTVGSKWSNEPSQSLRYSGTIDVPASSKRYSTISILSPNFGSDPLLSKDLLPQHRVEEDLEVKDAAVIPVARSGRVDDHGRQPRKRHRAPGPLWPIPSEEADVFDSNVPQNTVQVSHNLRGGGQVNSSPSRYPQGIELAVAFGQRSEHAISQANLVTRENAGDVVLDSSLPTRGSPEPSWSIRDSSFSGYADVEVVVETGPRLVSRFSASTASVAHVSTSIVTRFSRSMRSTGARVRRAMNKVPSITIGLQRSPRRQVVDKSKINIRWDPSGRAPDALRDSEYASRKVPQDWSPSPRRSMGRDQISMASRSDHSPFVSGARNRWSSDAYSSTSALASTTGFASSNTFPSPSSQSSLASPAVHLARDGVDGFTDPVARSSKPSPRRPSHQQAPTGPVPWHYENPSPHVRTTPTSRLQYSSIDWI